MSEKDNDGNALLKEQAHPDRFVWLIWVGMVLVTIIALPFVVRQTVVVKTIADMCMTTLSAGR